MHNLWELLRLGALCGCLCFSMRLVVALDFFATLTGPAAFGYLVYLICSSIATQTVPTLTLYVLAGLYGSQIVIFLLNRQFAHIGWMVISVMAMPLFNFVLPVYSFWNFDDFSWGNTRLIVGEKKDLGHGSGGGGGESKFDPSSLPLQKWDDYVAQVNKTSSGKKGKNGADSAGRSTIGDAASIKTAPIERSQMNSPNHSLYSNASNARSTVALAQLGFSRPASGNFRSSQIRSSVSREDLLQISSRQGSKQNLLAADDEDEVLGPAEDDISRQIERILDSADLSKITKRMIREQLATHYGLDMSYKRDFINSKVDAILSNNRL